MPRKAGEDAVESGVCCVLAGVTNRRVHLSSNPLWVTPNRDGNYDAFSSILGLNSRSRLFRKHTVPLQRLKNAQTCYM